MYANNLEAVYDSAFSQKNRMGVGHLKSIDALKTQIHSLYKYSLYGEMSNLAHIYSLYGKMSNFAQKSVISKISEKFITVLTSNRNISQIEFFAKK